MAEFDLDRDALPEIFAASPVSEKDGASTGDVHQDGNILAEAEKPAPSSAAEWKAEGNRLYVAKDFVGAIECYTNAIEALPERPKRKEKQLEAAEDVASPKSESNSNEEFYDVHDTAEAAESSEIRPHAAEQPEEEEEEEVVEDLHAKDRSIFHCNRAACNAQLDHHKQVIEDCTVAIECDPTYVKAYVRRSQALEKEEQYSEALKDMEQVLKLDPSNKTALASTKRLKQLEEEKMEKLKTETLSKLKDLGNSILGNFGLSTDNFKFEKDNDTGSYNVQFVQKPEN